MGRLPAEEELTEPVGPRRSAEAERVAALYDQAVELATDDRRALLDHACAGRPELRAELESLIAAHFAAATFLERSPIAELGAGGGAPAEAGNRRAGPYRLLAEIGRGGMGTVYLAERADGAFEQQVALKLVRAGFVSGAMVERFLRERQILARLDHPNIARLLDGGLSEDGRPYFAMELVHGTPLTAYCDDRRLPIAARLELLEQACWAVQHAHASLIVHRDLKPANMLVAEGGNLKLLDFGIAKVLSEEPGEGATALTRAGLQPLTPAYAAPEQLRGQPATTATDVYSLGVVLYELLAGRRPRWAGLGDPDTAPREAEPPSRAIGRAATARGDLAAGEASAAEVATARATSPARLRRAVAGDLEAIVMQALQLDPARRYLSVEALAEDLRRFRAGQPVRARRATLPYRMAKLVRRHRVAAAAATVAVLSLVAGLAASLWQARVAARERDRAEASAAEAQEVSQYLVDLFRNTDPEHSAGGAVTARELLDRGAARLEVTLGDRPLTRARLAQAIASVYHSMRLLDQERELLEDALAVREREQGADHPDLVAPLLALGANHFRATRYPQAQANLDRAMSIAERHGRQQTEEYARALLQLGNLNLVQGSWPAAEAHYRRVLALLETLGPTERLEPATVLNNLGVALTEQGRHQEAMAVHRRALKIREGKLGRGHFTVAQSLINLARLDLDRGEPAAAEPVVERALAIFAKTYGRDHPSVAETLALRAQVAAAGGRQQVAEAAWREALRIREAALGSSHPETAATRLRLARWLAGEGRADEALPLAAAALATLAAVDGADPRDVLRARALVAQLRLDRGDPAGAAEAMGVATASAEAVEGFAVDLVARGLTAEAAGLRAAVAANGRR